jgi:hypothetical protein
MRKYVSSHCSYPKHRQSGDSIIFSASRKVLP